MGVGNKVLEICRDRHPLRRLTAGLIGRSGLGKLLKMKIRIQDYYIFFHPTSLCSLYWYEPTARSEDYEFISSFLKEGDIYLDIGANIGVTVIPAVKSVGERGRVIAFEAHPSTYLYLQENLELNKLNNVEIQNCAVGNHNGYIYFSDKFTDDRNQVSTTSENSIKIPMVSLDKVLKEQSNIALLKLDVEGYEKFVLEGARQTLENVRCIYFEVAEKNFTPFGYHTSDILQFLEQSGFKLFKKKDNQKEILHIDSEYVPSSDLYENLFGIKNIEEFQNRTQWRVSSREGRIS